MPLNCPKCNEPMRRLEAANAHVDRCEKCYGVWLDEGERMAIQTDKSLAAGLDVGPAEVGAAQDAITEVDCPRCGIRMQHMTDPAQKHIGYEECRQCKGSFFDAGELRDLSEFTLAERIRSFLGK